MVLVSDEDVPMVERKAARLAELRFGERSFREAGDVAPQLA